MGSVRIPDLSYNLLFFQKDEGICIQENRKIGKQMYRYILYSSHLGERWGRRAKNEKKIKTKN